MTAATHARLMAGLSLEQAARLARVSTDYLRQVERSGAPYALARRLAAHYNAPIQTFLPTVSAETNKRTSKPGVAARRGHKKQ